MFLCLSRPDLLGWIGVAPWPEVKLCWPVENILTCTSQESDSWFSKPDTWGSLLSPEVLWGLWDEWCSTASGGNLILAKRDQAESCLGFGLLCPARSEDHSPFLAGLSCHAHCWATSDPVYLWVNVARYLSPAGSGAMWVWIWWFTEINTYLSAN